MQPLKRTALFVLAVLLFLPTGAFASEAECIKLAAYPDDGGVSDKDFDAVNALLVCKPAADAAPDNAELSMFAARSYMALNKGKEALGYLSKAANKGSWRAQFTLYDWATRNPPILPQTDEVKMKLLTAAAKSGPPHIGVLLIEHYVEGRFTKKNLTKAGELAKELSGTGYVPAMRMYGQMVDAGVVAGVDRTTGIALIERAAKAGDVKAMLLYGESLTHTSDHKKGLNWLNKAADLNNERAQRLVINILQNGRGRIKANKSQAERTLKKWADKGFLIALTTLGRDHTKRGLKSGPAYLKRAYDAGDRESAWLLVNHYNKKKDKSNTQKWLDIMWDKGDLAQKARVLDFYNKEKDLSAFSRAFARIEAELLKRDPIEGHFAAAQMLSGRYKLTGLHKYWKAAEKNIALYLQKGGEQAAIKVSGLLLPHVKKQAKYYDGAKYNRYYGPMFKSMYETLLDIVLADTPGLNKQAFLKDRKKFSDAVDTAMKLHNQGLRKVSESNNLAAFLRRGHARDCGTIPRLPSDNASGKAVNESNTRSNKWRTCVDAKFGEAVKRKGDLSFWQGYRETSIGFEKYSIQSLHSSTITAFMKKITADKEKLNNAIVARNERIAKK